MPSPRRGAIPTGTGRMGGSAGHAATVSGSRRASRAAPARAEPAAWGTRLGSGSVGQAPWVRPRAMARLSPGRRPGPASRPRPAPRRPDRRDRSRASRRSPQSPRRPPRDSRHGGRDVDAACRHVRRAGVAGWRAGPADGAKRDDGTRAWAAMVCEPDRHMAETTTRPPVDAPASAYDPTWIADHLAEERQASSLLGEIREVVFGLQDGLVSTLAVVATVAGASGPARSEERRVGKGG